MGNVRNLSSGVASPKKVGGPNHVSLLGAVKITIYIHGIPPICKKLFNGFALIPGGV